MTDLKKLLDEATPGPWWVQAAEDSPKDISHVWRASPNPHTYKGGQSQTWIATVLRSDYHGDVVSAAPKDAALIVAAVNAVPELLALREEVGRLREQVRELSDCQRLPKVYRYTGTAEVDVENMFDVGHRHRSGKQPRDYLMSWLSMFRPFAYATKDDSWGELEKLISIVMNNYVQILVRAEKARAALRALGE